LVVKTDGKEQTGNSVINFLNPDWVKHVFEQPFVVQAVVNFSLSQGRDRPNITDKELKWLDVPAGNVLLKPVKLNIVRKEVPVKYQQGMESTCVFSCFTSLLYHLGHKDAANKTQQRAKDYVDLPLRQQLDGLASCVRLLFNFSRN